MALLGLPFLAYAEVASLYLRPASGVHAVDSTFEIGIYLNTGGNTVNAIRVDVSFPPDKVQVVSPTLGKSLVSFWIVQPTFSNSAGTISFQGGIPPPGINITDGLISTAVFRVVGIGQAAISVKDSSRVYLADGKGSNILGTRSDAIFNFILPPPNGPIVVAPKHPDPNKWYQDDDVEFAWEMPRGATSVSYVLNNEPLTVPDDIVEGAKKNSVVYKDLPSGTHYFHIKALNPEVSWGGTSHFLVNVDDEPPAAFSLEISPREKTSVRRPTLIFSTTDTSSGISHYTLKTIKTSSPPNVNATDAVDTSVPFWIQIISPFVLPELEFGSYSVVLRAHDLAGNFREVQKKLTISQAFFRNIGPDGLNFRSNMILPWWLVYILFSLAGLLIFYLAHFAYRRHREVENRLATGALNLVERAVFRRIKLLQQKREDFDKNKISK